MNAEFQELNRRYSISHDNNERSNILQSMKSNLLSRNQGNDTYAFNYTQPGKVLRINESNYSELLEINGDMNPQGI